MFLYYKNSLLASIVSILGCIFAIILVSEFKYYSIGEIIPMTALALAGIVGGKLISNEKAFKTWWKQVKDAGLDEKMKTDAQVAQYVYSKNAKKRTIKEIAKYNPAAAQALAAKK